MRYLMTFIHGTTWLNERLGRWFISYLAFVIFCLLLFEMVARYVFSSPTIWATELTQMMFGAYVMLSGGYLLVHRGHINVDIFYARLSPRRRAMVDIITSMLFFAFLLVLLKEGWQMADDAISRWEHSHSAWNPPVWPLRAAVPVGAALLFLQGVCKLIEDIAITIDPDRFAGGEDGEQGDYL